MSTSTGSGELLLRKMKAKAISANSIENLAIELNKFFVGAGEKVLLQVIPAQGSKWNIQPGAVGFHYNIDTGEGSASFENIEATGSYGVVVIYAE